MRRYPKTCRRGDVMLLLSTPRAFTERSGIRIHDGLHKVLHNRPKQTQWQGYDASSFRSQPATPQADDARVR